MRRGLTEAKPQAIEDSQAELAHIESIKNSTQEHVLLIAKNKKELEDAFEDAKKRLDEELTLKRAAHAKEIDDMEQKHRNMEMAVTTMESVQSMTKEETSILEQVRDSVKKDIADLHDEKAKEKAEVTRLQILIHNLGDSVKDARTDYKELQEKIVPLQKDLPLLQSKIKTATEELNTLTAKTSTEREVHNTFVDERIKHEATTASLSRDISEKTKQKADLDIELVDAQKKLSEVKQQAAAIEADMAAKAGDLSRLETRVDDKIAVLKEAKKEFTTDAARVYGAFRYVTMVSTPTITLYSFSNTVNDISDSTNNGEVTNFAAQTIGDSGFLQLYYVSGTLTPGRGYFFNYTAAAEL